MTDDNHKSQSRWETWAAALVLFVIVGAIIGALMVAFEDVVVDAGEWQLSPQEQAQSDETASRCRRAVDAAGHRWYTVTDRNWAAQTCSIVLPDGSSVLLWFKEE